MSWCRRDFRKAIFHLIRAMNPGRQMVKGNGGLVHTSHFPENRYSSVPEFMLLIGWLIACLGPVSVLYHLRLMNVPKGGRKGKVSLVLALTGPVNNLETLFSALSGQRLQPRRLIVAVESEEDLACQRLEACRAMLPFPVQLVVAGLAESSGQKSKNLLAALALIDDEDDVVVFLDADIVPAPEWLSYLASPILMGRYDVVSGYRWQWVEHATPAKLIIACIDRSIALLPRSPRFSLPWGGSVALGKLALNRIDKTAWLAQSISDDCALGLEIKRLGLRTMVRRILLVKSPLQGSAKSLWGFGRRQYQMIRFYMPVLWWLALFLTSLRSLAWGMLLLPSLAPWALPGALALYAVALAGVLLQQQVAARLSVQDASSQWSAIGLAVLMKPVIDIVHLSLVLGSALTRVVVWGHVRYRVANRGDVRVIARKTWTALGK